MRRFSLLVLALMLALVGIAAARPAAADTAVFAAASHKPVKPAAVISGGLSECGEDGMQDSGAIYRICMPPDWHYNNQLVIWAHGYVDFLEPVGIPEDQLCIDGFCIPDITNTLGFGFATTSYSVNGLAVLQGMADILDLVNIYTAQEGAPERVFLIGASEGGIITTLLSEQNPDIFAAGTAMCGPIGNFQRQIDFFGDVRVIFNYLYPDLGALLGDDPTNIPPEVIENWSSIWNDQIKPVVFDEANAGLLDQLVIITNMPHDANDYLGSLETSVEDALWYNVFATNDANEKLGGNPFDNMTRWYRGSDNDLLMNLSVQRVAADEAALIELENYQTTGDLQIPLVTLHTLQDQQVPYWHEPLYGRKLGLAGNRDMRFNMPINRYEHCNFTPGEALVAFGITYYLANQEALDMSQVAALLPNPANLATYEQTFAAFLAGR